MWAAPAAFPGQSVGFGGPERGRSLHTEVTVRVTSSHQTEMSRRRPGDMTRGVGDSFRMKEGTSIRRTSPTEVTCHMRREVNLIRMQRRAAAANQSETARRQCHPVLNAASRKNCIDTGGRVARLRGALRQEGTRQVAPLRWPVRPAAKAGVCARKPFHAPDGLARLR